MTKFKEFVDQKGISGYKLAKDSGLAQSHIQMLLSGRRSIKSLSLELASKLSRALGITIEELLELTEPTEAEGNKNMKLYRVYNQFGYDYVAITKPDGDMWDLYEIDLSDYDPYTTDGGEIMVKVNNVYYPMQDIVRFEGDEAVLLVPKPYGNKKDILNAKKIG